MIIKRFTDKKEVKRIKEVLRILYLCKPNSKFAWLPVELANQDFVWFGFYVELKYELFYYDSFNLIRVNHCSLYEKLKSDDPSALKEYLKDCNINNINDYNILYDISNSRINKLNYRYIPKNRISYGDRFIHDLLTHNDYGLLIDQLIEYYTIMLFKLRMDDKHE